MCLAVVVAACGWFELQGGVPNIEVFADAGVELGENAFGAAAGKRFSVDLHVGG